MKKFLLIGALVVAGMTNAKELNPLVAQKAQLSFPVEKRVAYTGVESVSADNFVLEMRAKRAKQATEYDGVDWYFAPGQLYYGLHEGWSAYQLAAIVLPYQKELVWENGFGPTDWTLYDGTIEANTETTTPLNTTGLFGVAGLLPQTSDHDYVVGDSTYHYKGTKYGQTTNSYVAMAPEEHYFNGTDNVIMTPCAMYTDPYNRADGSDMFYITNNNPAYGKWYIGTGRLLDLAKPNETADTIGIIIDNNANMKISQIHFYIINNTASEPQGLIPDGAEIRVALFPMEGRTINFSDTIASTVMTNEGLEPGSNSGCITAKFYEEDIFGTLTPVDIYTGGSFYLQITNFNETGCDFAFFTDYFCPATYTTVFQQDGEFKFLANGGQNVAVMFDGYYPTLINDTTTNELNAPSEGGYAYYGNDTENVVSYMFSNVNPENWEIDTEADWAIPSIDTTYLSQYGFTGLFFECEELPAEVAGRTAIVTIYADGAEQVFTIHQGEDIPHGIVNTKVDAIFDNKSYDLLGREIKDQYFKGVMIRNGKKTLVK